MRERILYKIVSFVSREELDFLDRIAKDIYFSTKRKVPRSQIIREIIQMAKDLRSFGNDLIKELSRQSQEHIEGQEMPLKSTVKRHKEGENDA